MPHKSKMADDRHLKNDKLLYFNNRLTDVGEIWCGDAYRPSQPDQLLKI